MCQTVRRGKAFELRRLKLKPRFYTINPRSSEVWNAYGSWAASTGDKTRCLLVLLLGRVSIRHERALEQSLKMGFRFASCPEYRDSMALSV